MDRGERVLGEFSSERAEGVCLGIDGRVDCCRSTRHLATKERIPVGLGASKPCGSIDKHLGCGANNANSDRSIIKIDDNETVG